MLLLLLSYVGFLVGFVLLVLSIALGLYYLSEIVEEHTEPTKRFLTRIIYGIMATFVLLWLFDSFPFWLLVFLIFSYYVYLQNLTKFPYVELTSPIFLISCALVITNHFLWFNHFLNPPTPLFQERLQRGYEAPVIPLYLEVVSFFGLCVWFMPFALFISLSSHDHLLPHHDENAGKGHRNTSLAKVVLEATKARMYEVARKSGFELDRNYGSLG